MCYSGELMNHIFSFSPDQLEKLSNISSQPDLLKRVLRLECEIFKANDHIKALKQKCRDKDEKIRRLETENANLNKTLNESSDVLTVGYFNNMLKI